MAKRVRTEAGAKYYGVPIGHLITPDQEDDAVARHGGRPAPHGSLTGSNQKRAGQSSADNSKTSPQTSEKAVKSDNASAGSRKIVKPSISGPVPVLVGKRKYSAPEGSKVYTSPNNPGRSYVVTPEGHGYVFTSHGVLDLTPEQSKALATQVQAKLSPEGSGEEEEVTWVRLVSLVRQIHQATEAGDESAARKLMLQLREEANRYDPESDPREIKTRIKKATGLK